MNTRTLIVSVAILAALTGWAAGEKPILGVVERNYPAGHESAVKIFVEEEPGCSGCMIKLGDDYFVLTARHCGHQGNVRVRLKSGRFINGKVVYIQPGAVDACTLIKVEGGGYQYSRIASRAPAIGETVYSYGYPGPNNRLEYQAGRVTALDDDIKDDPTWVRSFIQVRFPIRFGWSGSPLFNTAGEIVGVASRSNLYSMSLWVKLSIIREAMRSTHAFDAVKDKPIVIVFTEDWCAPCRKLKQDYQSGKLKHQKYEWRFIQESVGSPWKTKFIQKFGRTPPSLPTIWVVGSGKYTTGYAGPASILRWIGSVLATLIEGIIRGPQGQEIRDDSLIQRLIEDIRNLREDKAKIQEKLAKLDGANVLEKAALVPGLIADAKKAKKDLADTKKDLVTSRGKIAELGGKLKAAVSTGIATQKKVAELREKKDNLFHDIEEMGFVHWLFVVLSGAGASSLGFAGKDGQ